MIVLVVVDLNFDCYVVEVCVFCFFVFGCGKFKICIDLYGSDCDFWLKKIIYEVMFGGYLIVEYYLIFYCGLKVGRYYFRI